MHWVFLAIMLGWPLVVVTVFLVLFSGRLRSPLEFGVIAALMLYGISKLVSTELLPWTITLLPIDPGSMASRIRLLHLAAQVPAILLGILLQPLVNRYLVSSGQ